MRLNLQDLRFFVRYAGIEWRGNRRNRTTHKLMLVSTCDVVLENLNAVFEDLLVRWSNVENTYSSTTLTFVTSIASGNSNSKIEVPIVLFKEAFSFCFFRLFFFLLLFLFGMCDMLRVEKSISKWHGKQVSCFTCSRAQLINQTLSKFCTHFFTDKTFIDTSGLFLRSWKNFALFVRDPIQLSLSGRLTYIKTRDGYNC